VTQPEYVPIASAARVRPAERLPPARPWLAQRPGDLKGPLRPTGPGFGTAGPDQGYALKLAHQLAGRLQLAQGHDLDDAMAGCLGIALRRASLFGRAPVIWDLELAFTLWGYMGDAPADLVEERVRLFQGAAHDYWLQRAIADRVPETTLRLTPAQVVQRLKDWRTLLTAAS
jgi:hypothetical protein